MELNRLFPYQVVGEVPLVPQHPYMSTLYMHALYMAWESSSYMYISQCYVNPKEGVVSSPLHNEGCSHSNVHHGKPDPYAEILSLKRTWFLTKEMAFTSSP